MSWAAVRDEFRPEMGSIMALLRRWLGQLVIAGVLVGTRGMADTPAQTADSRIPPPLREEPGRSPTPSGPTSTTPTGEQSLVAPSPLFLDMLKFPAGAVLVVCEQAREAMRLVPKMVVLTPQEY